MTDFGLQIDPNHEDGIEFKVTTKNEQGEEITAGKRVIDKSGVIRWVFQGVRP